MPEEPALNHTEPSSDDNVSHISALRTDLEHLLGTDLDFCFENQSRTFARRTDLEHLLGTDLDFCFENQSRTFARRTDLDLAVLTDLDITVLTDLGHHYDELSKKELKQIEADDQAIQTFLLDLPKDIYAAVDSCETAQEIWLRVQQMMKGYDIEIHEKNAKNKHFPEKIASNLKFLNNLQPEWSRHVTIVHQTKDLHTANYSQLYDFLKYNQKEVIQNAVQNPRVQNITNQNGLIGVQGNGNHNQIGNGNLVTARAEGNAAGKNGNQISAPIYDSNGSAEVHKNCDDNEIFNMFTQEEQYTELLEPIPESHQVPQNDNDVISEDTSVEQEETLQLAQEIREKMKQLNKEIKPANYTKINHLSGHKALELEIEHLLKAVVSQDIMNIMQKKSVVDTSDLQTELERIFRINPFKTFREAKNEPTSVRESDKKKPITVSQPPVITKKDVNSDVNGLSSTGVDNSKTRRPQPKSNTKNDRVPSASKSSRSKNKEAEVEEHHRNLLLFKNNKHMSSACNNIKLESQDVISKVVYAMCKQCLISVNHDACLRNYVNGKNSRAKKQKAKVSVKEIQKKYQPKVTKPKKVGLPERLATPKPRKPRFLLRWSPTDKLFDQKGKLVASNESESQSDCSNGDNACTSNTLEPKIKRFPNSTFLLDRLFRIVYAAILGFGDLQWGNILITRVYFVEGLGYNLFSVGQFYDSDLEVAFRRNACFVRNLEGVDLLKGDRSTNLYTINFHEMASASPICLMAQASNDLVSGLPKFKYHKEHLCPSCEQGKSKRASHPPLCGPMRIASINVKRVVERRNRTLVEAARTMLIFSHAPLFLWAEAIATACFTQNRSIIHRRFNKTPYELINGKKPNISFLHVFGALCYPKNDHEDIG
nr:hypothetical protein [Tanacetum cinerariifolium]